MRSDSVLTFDFHFENFSNFDLFVLNDEISATDEKNCDSKILLSVIIFEMKIEFFDKFEKL